MKSDRSRRLFDRLLDPRPVDWVEWALFWVIVGPPVVIAAILAVGWVAA